MPGRGSGGHGQFLPVAGAVVRHLASSDRCERWLTDAWRRLLLR